jgi:hypothetical protein
MPKKKKVINNNATKIVEKYMSCYTLNLKCITSPSSTTYSLPSTLNFPAYLTFA